MKRLFVTSLTFALALAVSVVASAQDWKDDSEFTERDEFRQTYELSAGARVELKSINGAVEIETHNGSAAEVHIVRLARNREDLEYRKISVHSTGSTLVVEGEKDRDRNWRGRDREVRQRVTLRIPRMVDFHVSGINGRVRAGEIDGTLHASGINGSVSVARAVGYANISGVNGRVSVTIAELSERGINVSGINGGVEIQFADDLNAELEVTGCNGRVYADVPNVTMLGKVTRDNFRARIGSGGTRITVSGVNGRVRLSRAGSAG